jgi:hypothetical protein
MAMYFASLWRSLPSRAKSRGGSEASSWSSEAPPPASASTARCRCHDAARRIAAIRVILRQRPADTTAAPMIATRCCLHRRASAPQAPPRCATLLLRQIALQGLHGAPQVVHVDCKRANCPCLRGFFLDHRSPSSVRHKHHMTHNPMIFRPRHYGVLQSARPPFPALLGLRLGKDLGRLRTQCAGYLQ